MPSLKRTIARFFGLATLLAFCHWLVLVFSAGIAMGRGLHRIDHPEFPVTFLERTCIVLMRVLQEPLNTVERIFQIPRGWPGIVVGMVFSLLWGAALAFCVLAVSGRAVNE